MLSIAEFADQQEPEAIAEIVRQELQPLNIKHLAVEVAIVDSSLEIQIRTNSAIDKEKLLTLLSSELQNLQIESVAKFRIHCWRNDEEIHEQRLLWTEQFMIESPKYLPKLSLAQDITSSDNLPIETRSPEPQLSKHSVLQQAIHKIAPAHPAARQHIAPTELGTNPENNVLSNGIAFTKVTNTQSVGISPSNTYWQLLLVGASIVLLGLGIGASVRALTVKREVSINSANSNNTEPSNPALSSIKKPATLPKNVMPTQRIIPTPSSIDVSPTARPNQDLLADTGLITLEKFNLVQKGMTVAQVENIFGVAGKVIAENSSSDGVGTVYSWKNPQGSNAIIEFKDGQVVAKAQAGL
ncbi:hypothetical protein HCU40_07775 [Pseudanabaena biceps]|nr:hypothetical protein [Pseudanabaena biceps]